MTSANLSTRPMSLASFALLCLAGCAAFGERGQALVPTAHQTKAGPFVVFTDYPVAHDDGIVKGLGSLKIQLEETLGLKVESPDQPIEVYILNDRKAFEHFLTFYYPGLPTRRAFFIAQGDRRVVYTFKGDRLEEDLRHEATHALMHLIVGDIPLWLDEGLAEYFEVTDSSGLNGEHLAKLPEDIREGWSPGLERLEELKAVEQMSPRDYRESWAWVHLLLNGPGEDRAVLLSYLGDLRAQGRVNPLSKRLPAGETELATLLLKHVDDLKKVKPPSIAASEPTIRLQDRGTDIEPMAAPSKKRGFFGRVFGKLFP